MKTMLFKPGDTVTGKWKGNKYLIIKALGSGGIGEVYLVKDRQSNKVLALKISADWQSINREYEILCKLNKNNNIRALNILPEVYLLDDTTYSGTNLFFFTMEYKPGENLLAIRRKKVLDEEKLLAVVLKIGIFLHHLHRMGYVFGDLKAANIIFNPLQNKTSLVDLGAVTPIGQCLKEYTPTYDRCAWKAGTRRADAGYDFFSLALLILQLQGSNKYAITKKNLQNLIRQSDNNALGPIIKKALKQEYHESRDLVTDAFILYSGKSNKRLYLQPFIINSIGIASILFFIASYLYYLNQ